MFLFCGSRLLLIRFEHGTPLPIAAARQVTPAPLPSLMRGPLLPLGAARIPIPFSFICDACLLFSGFDLVLGALGSFLENT